eukprot:m.131455 g.131455  ORF g.131455 m.131455 type:complete len:103 (-) comp29549_c0_seq1:25-333(-)
MYGFRFGPHNTLENTKYAHCASTTNTTKCARYHPQLWGKQGSLSRQSGEMAEYPQCAVELSVLTLPSSVSRPTRNCLVFGGVWYFLTSLVWQYYHKSTTTVF